MLDKLKAARAPSARKGRNHRQLCCRRAERGSAQPFAVLRLHPRVAGPLAALFRRKQDNIQKPPQGTACWACDDYADPANPLSPFSPLNPMGFGGHSLPAGGLGMTYSEDCGCCASCDGSSGCSEDSGGDSDGSCSCDGD